MGTESSVLLAVARNHGSLLELERVVGDVPSTESTTRDRQERDAADPGFVNAQENDK